MLPLLVQTPPWPPSPSRPPPPVAQQLFPVLMNLPDLTGSQGRRRGQGRDLRTIRMRGLPLAAVTFSLAAARVTPGLWSHLHMQARLPEVG